MPKKAGEEIVDEVAEVEAVEAEAVVTGTAGETPEAPETATAEPEAEAEDGGFEITIGDEVVSGEAESGAPEWVKQVRIENRAYQKRVRELEAKLAETAGKLPALGAKPTLATCDYDEDRFDAELDAWHVRKRELDAAEAKAKAEEAAQQQAYQERLSAYAKAKNDLPVDDYEEAEATATEALNVTQQAIIVRGSDNPALVIYALGRNPARAKELSAINDPVLFTFAVAKLEAQLKLTKRPKAPPPESVVRSATAPIGGSVDNQLERLRAEAAQTGDYSKVTAYRQKMRASAS